MKEGKYVAVAVLCFFLSGCGQEQTFRRTASLERKLDKYERRYENSDAKKSTDAVQAESSLAWLSQTHSANGYWPALEVGGHSDIISTALAVTGFIGAGYMEKTPPSENRQRYLRYRKCLLNGLDFLIKNQAGAGSLNRTILARGMQKGATRSLVNLETALGLLAFSEASIHDPRYKSPAMKAAGHLLSVQRREGGWDLGPPPPTQEGTEPVKACSDTYVTCWVIMALESARRNGVDVNVEANLGRARLFLNRVTGIQPDAGGEQTPMVFATLEYLTEKQLDNPGFRNMYSLAELTAMTTLCRFYLGDTTKVKFIRLARDKIMQSELYSKGATLLFFGHLAVCVTGVGLEDVSVKDYSTEAITSIRAEYYPEDTFTPEVQSGTDKMLGPAGVAGLVAMTESTLLRQLQTK